MLQEAKEREYLFRGKKESSKETSKSLFVTVMDFLAFPEEHMSCPTILAFHNMDGRDEVEDTCTRPSHEGSSLESKNCDQGVDNSTFQEKHQSGPSVEMPALPLRSEEDMDSRDQPEKITFERVMDAIAFPEKHLPCPSLEAFKAPYLMGKSEVSKNNSEKKSLEITFERIMTAMAFPKKQLAFHMCPTSNTTQRENSEEGSRVETKDCSEENMFDSVLNPLAFPEKYLEKMMEFAAFSRNEKNFAQILAEQNLPFPKLSTAKQITEESSNKVQKIEENGDGELVMTFEIVACMLFLASLHSHLGDLPFLTV